MRLRPILMTSFAFILGVVPLVLAKGAGAEMRVALGVAVFSGMLGVTFFGLFFTPVFYFTIRRFAGRRGPIAPAAVPPPTADLHAEPAVVMSKASRNRTLKCMFKRRINGQNGAATVRERGYFYSPASGLSQCSECLENTEIATQWDRFPTQFAGRDKFVNARLVFELFADRRVTGLLRGNLASFPIHSWKFIDYYSLVSATG